MTGSVAVRLMTLLSVRRKESMKEEYYRLTLEKVEPVTGIALRAFRHCIACNQVVDSQGGGHDFICMPCSRILGQGLLKEEFAIAKDELIKQMTKPDECR